MRKTLISALVASAFAVTGAAHAGLAFDLNGAAAGGGIQADAFDWSPTSFLALGGNSAITNFVGGCVSSCNFEVLTHSLLTTYTESGTGTIKSALDFGQITMVARYTETVVGFTGGAFPNAIFSSTGAGSVEFYYNGSQTANSLTGSGFDEGTLIGRLTGVTVDAVGSFLVTGTNAGLFYDLDGNGDGNQYTDGATSQLTVRGTGSQDNLDAGLVGKDLDSNFFITALAGFQLQYNNISIGLPYGTTNPSDCFGGGTATGANNLGSRSVGTAGYASTCDMAHQAANYAGQANLTGYTPDVGMVNGLDLGNPDFVAQTDFNSAVAGSVPEPGSLALVGLALAGLGLARRRRAA